jgi:endoglycosylceramidase
VCSSDLVFWDALEPMPGVIDEAYLDRIEARLDWFAAHGIHVMLDMHQDVYARRFCCDGAPEWAIRDDGEPFTLQSTWSLNYFQPAVMRAFDNFWAYEEHRDLQDHYAAAWEALASRFRDHPAVLGYDLMNEPWPGSAFDSRELRPDGAGPSASTAEFDRTLFASFYERVIARVRAVDTEHWIFVEPRNTAAGGAMQFVPELDDPRAGPSRIVWAPHLYSVRYEASMSYDRGEDLTVSRWARSREEETRLHDWPILMGEFGMDPSYPGASEYLDDVLAMADETRINWAYWTFNGSWGFWDPVAGAERPHVAQIVRAYPQRVAGTPTAWSWDRATRTFSLTFEAAAGVTGETEIFVPAARFYPTGFDVSSSDADGTWSYTFDDAHQRVSIVASDDTTHTFTITPR